MSATAERKHTALRFPAEALNEIDRLARYHSLNRTDYLIAAGTGQLNPVSTTEERLQALEQRLSRLEELAFSGE